MSDPFQFSEEDKVVLVLARILYLKHVIHRGEEPNPDPLFAGSPVHKSVARTCVSLLEYPDGVLNDLIAEAQVLFDSAVKIHKDKTNTAA